MTLANGRLLVGVAGVGLAMSAAWGQNELTPMPVGGEIRQAERNIQPNAQPPRKAVVAPVIEAIEAPLTVPSPAEAVATNGAPWDIRTVKLAGDSGVAERLGVIRALTTTFPGKTCTRGQVESALQRLNKRLVDHGYYLARVSLPRACFENGVLTVAFDPGRIGKLGLKFKDGSQDGRWFNRSQILQKFYGVDPGTVFDYSVLRDRLYAINSQPDLTLDTVLNVRKEIENDLLVRYVDLDFAARESFPLHAVLDVNNYATKAVGDWQAGLTLQYLNLTKNDDVLTINPASTFDQSLQSIAASYELPHHLGNGGHTTVYGGYSKLDADDVVPSIGVQGSGWFVGIEESYNLIDDHDRQVSVSAGIVRRYFEEQLIVAGLPAGEQPITLMPAYLTVGYTDRTPDLLGGRNFATLAGYYNLGNHLGASDKQDFADMRVGAEPDYLIGRAQLARLQPLFGRTDDLGQQIHQWMLFLRLEGQLANTPLVPAEELQFGGPASVRGYAINSRLGDDGVFGTVELRTPVLLDLLRTTALGAGAAKGSSTPFDRLQFVAFFDAGRTRVQEPLPGEESGTTLASWGLGMRLAATQHVQFKLDWGVPLINKISDDNSSAFYLDMQVQF